MSGGLACRCFETVEPLTMAPGSNRPARLWRVIQRQRNFSAFNGYRYTPSAYSSLTCLRCGACWRSRAAFISELPDIAAEEKFISRGYANHAAAMAQRGREPCS